LRGGYGHAMLEIDGDDVRITGLRVLGPSRSTDKDTPRGRGIITFDNLYTRSIIDHNELSDWSEAAVSAFGGDESKTCRDHRTDHPARPENVRVARNFIHHNRVQNAGYGVCTKMGGYAMIEGNTFVSNRHAITGDDGRARTGYRAFYNLVLADAPKQDRKFWFDDYTQDFDMHGSNTLYLDYGLGEKKLSAGFGGTGGEYMEIAYNTFLGANRQNFDLRGEPCFTAEFHHNISLRSLEDAVGCTYCGGGIDKLKVYDTNQFKSANPTLRLGVGDFDGDGKDDLFLATGAAWYYAPAGQAEWRFLSAQTDKIDTLRFGDFDGGGRTDAFTQHG